MAKKRIFLSDAEIIESLERSKKDFELEGIELTDEDVLNTKKLFNEGKSLYDACCEVLQGIYDCLN